MTETTNNQEQNVKGHDRSVKGMFDGPVMPLLIKLATPMLLGMMVQLVYNFVDRLFIGRIDLADPSYVGGSGMVFPIIFFAMAVANGLAVGVSSLIARAIGEKNHSILNKTAESGLFMAGIASVILIAVFYIFTNQMITLLGATGDYFVHAKEYLLFIIPAGVVVFVLNVFIGILQGEGRMQFVMWAMLIGTVLNIILDPIFIFVLNMGVSGAALATTIAQAIACAYLLIVFLKGNSSIKIEFHIRNVSARVMKQIIAVGLPQALGMIFMSFSFLIFNRIVISIDPDALTALTLTGTMEQIVLMPIFSIASAVVTVSGQNAGRGRLDRVEDVWKASLKLGAIAVAFFATVLVLAAPYIYRLFSSVEAVQRYAVLQTRIVEYTFIIGAAGILARAIFQGLGFSISAMLIMILRLLGLNVPFVFLYVYVFDFGIYGVWLGFVTGNILGGFLGFGWLKVIMKKLKSGELKVRSTSA